MNKPFTTADLVTPKVTSGPLSSSYKDYSSPASAPDLKVPRRMIELDPSSGEAALPVYDTTGPYTDPDVSIDVEKGLARTRLDWVKERGGVEEYEGRPIRLVDNGNVTGKHLARNFPNTPKPWRAVDRSPDGAKRNPGSMSSVLPHSASLHAGYEERRLRATSP